MKCRCPLFSSRLLAARVRLALFVFALVIDGHSCGNSPPGMRTTAATAVLLRTPRDLAVSSQVQGYSLACCCQPDPQGCLWTGPRMQCRMASGCQWHLHFKTCSILSEDADFVMTTQLSCLVWNHYHKWGKLRQSKTLAAAVADVDLTTQGRKARALSSAFCVLVPALMVHQFFIYLMHRSVRH